MNYIYIKELTKRDKISHFNRIPKWLQSFIWKKIKKFNFILKRKIEENKIIFLVSNKEKCYKKITRKIEKEKLQKLQIILSEKLKVLKPYFRNYKIIEGKIYFSNYIEEILKKALKEVPLEMQNIYFLTNQYSEQNIILIKKIAQKVKSINIITKDVKKYMRLEEIMQTEGIAICVSDNKRKSLKNAKIIINVDFLENEIEQYVLFRNALIINLTQEKFQLKSFEGIIIQDIEIELEEKQNEWIEKNNLKEEFKLAEIYETIIQNKTKENLYISKLYGNNGEITKKELINWQKILTN